MRVKEKAVVGKPLAMASYAMYDSSMRSETYPLALPEDLLAEVRATAKATGLSMADAMRQSMRLGLPKLKAELSQLKRLTPEQEREIYGPDKEWDELAAAMVKGTAFPREDE